MSESSQVSSDLQLQPRLGATFFLCLSCVSSSFHRCDSPSNPPPDKHVIIYSLFFYHHAPSPQKKETSTPRVPDAHPLLLPCTSGAVLFNPIHCLHTSMVTGAVSMEILICILHDRNTPGSISSHHSFEAVGEGFGSVKLKGLCDA